MIATTRGLAFLAGIAVLLLAVLLIASPRDTRPIDRSLVPGFDATKVSSLAISHGAARTQISRVASEWRIDSPPGVADPGAIDAIFTALRGGRWHRRASASAAGITKDNQPHGPRRLTFNGTTLAVGAALPGTGQTWLVRSSARGEDALLVDSWVATALTPSHLALRVRHPLDCGAANAITATTSDGAVRIEGTRLVEPRALWLDERLLRGLADACAQIEIVSLDGRAGDAPGLTIVVNGNRLAQTGTCADTRHVHVDTSTGAGCIEAAALQRLHDSIRQLAASAHDAIDLRPLPLDPVKLTLADGSVLDLTAKPRLGDIDADPDAVRTLLGALTTRGEEALPRPATKPTATMKAIDRTGVEVTLELFGHQLIGRAGEPGVIRLPRTAWDIITRPSAALRDPTRWREDATTLTSLKLDGVTYKRGAVLGEWSRDPAGTFDPALVDALVETVASVRAPTAVAPTAIVHRLTVTFAPPVGTETTHTIELAAAMGDGCAGRIDATPVLLPLPLCTAVVALASQR